MRSKRGATDAGVAASQLVLKERRDHLVSNGHRYEDGRNDEDEHEGPRRAFGIFRHDGTSVERVTAAVIWSALNHILKSSANRMLSAETNHCR